MKLSLSILASLASLSLASPKPPSFPRSSNVVHEIRGPVDQRWNSLGRLSPQSNLTVRIGLKQNNLEKASQFVADVYVQLTQQNAKPNTTTSVY